MTNESDERRATSHGDAARNYSGALELWDTNGQLLGVITVTVADIDEPVWSAESPDPINLGDIDPGGVTVMAQLANPAHPRAGYVASAHLQLRGAHVQLAGNYGFHAPADAKNGPGALGLNHAD